MPLSRDSVPEKSDGFNRALLTLHSGAAVDGIRSSRSDVRSLDGLPQSNRFRDGRHDFFSNCIEKREQ